jgi:hypothetical protein
VKAMPIHPPAFYEKSTSELRPGDIIYLSDWPPHQASYWAVFTSYCDLERRDHILLSKIEPFSAIPAALHDNIRQYKVFYLFYLPPIQGRFDESFVDYGMVYPFPRLITKAALNGGIQSRRICSLTDNARRLFHYHFANHITRNSIEFFKPEIEALTSVLDNRG